MTGSSSGLLALGALGSQAHLTVKDEKNHHELDHRGAAWSWGWGKRAGLGWRQGSCIGGPRKCCLSPYDQELANDLEFLVQGNQSLIPHASPLISDVFVLSSYILFTALFCPHQDH